MHILVAAFLSIAPVVETHRQDGGNLLVHYELRNDGNEPLDIKELLIEISGEVSNSSGGHPHPKSSFIQMVLPIHGPMSVSPERWLGLEWTGNSTRLDDLPSDAVEGTCNESVKVTFSTLLVEPKDTFTADIVITHDHLPHKLFHPLLGKRTIIFRRDSSDSPLYKGVVDFRVEKPVVGPALEFKVYENFRCSLKKEKSRPDAPDELDETAFLISKSENQWDYRLPEIKVRSHGWMLLEFDYLVARDSLGDLVVRVMWYEDTETSQRCVATRSEKINPPKQGRWYHYRKIVKVENEATSAAIQFKYWNSEPEMGDAYFRNVVFRPIGYKPETP